MRTRGGVSVAVVAGSLSLLVAPPAQAKAPPKGTYECVIGASASLFGSVSIKGGKSYRYSRFGGKGRFVAGKKLRKFSGGRVDGYAIRFKGGGLSKYKGYWFTSSTGTHEIALAKPGSDFINIYCDD